MSAEMSVFFICGRGRSGTWLLQSVLNSHSQLSMSPESLFVMDLKSRYGSKKEWTKELKIQFVDDLLLDEKITNWWTIEKESFLQYFNEKAIVSFQQATIAVYQYFAVKSNTKNVTLFGDKNPEYLLFIEDILEVFPNAKFIVMMRDPRANVASFMKTSFDSSQPLILAHRWKHYNQRIERLVEKYASQIHLLKFEELIGDFETQLRSLCEFLNVPFEQNLLTFYERPTKVFEWNKAITSPPDPSRLGAWKKDFDKKELGRIESVCSELMPLYGYNKEINEELSFLDKIQIFLSNISASAISKMEKNYFHIPLKLRHALIKIYRKKTKVIR